MNEIWWKYDPNGKTVNNVNYIWIKINRNPNIIMVEDCGFDIPKSEGLFNKIELRRGISQYQPFDQWWAVQIRRDGKREGETGRQQVQARRLPLPPAWSSPARLESEVSGHLLPREYHGEEEGTPAISPRGLSVGVGTRAARGFGLMGRTPVFYNVGEGQRGIESKR